MVKAYLRYEPLPTFGVVCSSQCNVEIYQQHAISGCNEEIIVWNLRKQEKEKTLIPDESSDQKCRSYCSRLQIQPGGSILAAGYSDGGVRLWDLTDYTNALRLQGHKNQITCLAWGNAKGVTVPSLLCSGGADTDIVIWDTISESGIARLRGHRDQITSCAFLTREAPTIVSCSKDKTIKVWSVETQVCMQTIVEQGELWSCAINLECTRLLVGSTDHLLRIWSISEEDEPLTFMGSLQRNKDGGKDSILGIRITKDKVFLHSRSKALEVFALHCSDEAARRKKKRRRRANEKLKKKSKENVEQVVENVVNVAAFQVSDEFTSLPIVRTSGKVVSVAWDEKNARVILGLQTNALEIVPMKIENNIVQTEGSFVMERPGHRNPVRSVAVSSDDAMIMSTSKEAVKIWNAHTGNCVRTLSSGYGLCGFFIAGNQQVIIGTMDGQIELYDLGVCEKVQSCKPHEGAIYGIVENPTHNGFATCSADKTVKFFELVQSGSRLAYRETDQVIELADDALSIQYSPNGKWIAVALLDATVQLYFVDTLKFYISFYGHTLPVMSVAFSSDSTILATGSADRNIKLWSTQFGNCHKSIHAHEENVMQVLFMPGTHYLISTGRDRAVKVWDCDTYEFIDTWGYHLGEVWGLALAFDASYVVTAGGDKALRIWKRTKDQLFLEEEREKEMDERHEQDAMRDDKGPNDVVAVRATRRTIESVRTTERLIETLDEAEGKNSVLIHLGRTPMVHVLRCVQSMRASDIYEVLLALPFSYAVKLLEFIVEVFESGKRGSTYSDELLCCGLETVCRAALITIHVHHTQIASRTDLLLRLRDHLRGVAISQRDLCGFNLAAMTHFRVEMKQNSHVTFDEKPRKLPRLI